MAASHASGPCQNHLGFALIAAAITLLTSPVTNCPNGKEWESPWEPFPILIKAVKILTFGDPTLTQKGFQYVFAGNPYTPDMMATLGAWGASNYTEILGNGMPFPAQGTPGARPARVVRACHYQIYYIIYYVPDLPQ